MRLPAIFITAMFFAVSLFLFSPVISPVSAQNASYSSDVNDDVPQNQHTRSQLLIIETSAALICQLVGIDIVDPEKGCLGVDTVSKKIGYAPVGDDEKIRVGGVLGMSAGLFGTVYSPPASGVQYVAQLKENFGIVKRSYAQEDPPPEDVRSGIDALRPVLKLWESSKNITYLLLVVVFVVIGLAIMLRVKIDPRTSMTIQNQIPKIIIAILLITFSYSIIGFMIDFMWLTTYVGINTLSTHTTQTVCNGGTASDLSIAEGAYANLMNIPIIFMNQLFTSEGLGFGGCQSGIRYLSQSVANSIGIVVNDLVIALFGVSGVSCDWGNILGCVAGNSLGFVLGWIGRFFALLVAFIAIIIVMFRLWWQLLKAYAYIIIYTIVGPFWILLGLLPNSTLSFSGWIRTLTAKLAVFPAAIFMIIIARVILDAYNKNLSDQVLKSPSLNFVPPLSGNPNMAELGPLVAFAILLITPELLNMLNDALKAPANKYTGPAITGGVKAGAILPGAVAGGVTARLMARDTKTGAGTGPITTLMDSVVHGRKYGDYGIGGGRGSGLAERLEGKRGGALLKRGLGMIAGTPSEQKLKQNIHGIGVRGKITDEERDNPARAASGASPTVTEETQK